MILFGKLHDNRFNEIFATTSCGDKEPSSFGTVPEIWLSLTSSVFKDDRVPMALGKCPVNEFDDNLRVSSLFRDDRPWNQLTNIRVIDNCKYLKKCKREQY